MQLQPFNLSQLAELALRRFEDDVLQHIARCFPERHLDHDELSWRRFIRANMARAQEYQLHSEWEQVRYIDLVFALGSNFEDDPRYAPLRAILEDPETNGQTRVMRCYSWLDNRGAP